MDMIKSEAVGAVGAIEFLVLLGMQGSVLA